MANVYLQDSTLTAIGNAIRTKAGNSDMLLPSEMAAAITNLPSGSSFNKITDMPTLCYSTSGGTGTRKTYTPTADGDVVSYSSLGFTNLEDFITNCVAVYWAGYLPKMSSATKPSGSAISAAFFLFPTLGQTIDLTAFKSLVANTQIVLPVGTGWGDGTTTAVTVGGWQTKNGSSATITSYGVGTFAFLSDSSITVKTGSRSYMWGQGSPAYAAQFPKSMSIIAIKRA